MRTVEYTIGVMFTLIALYLVLKEGSSGQVFSSISKGTVGIVTALQGR